MGTVPRACCSHILDLTCVFYLLEWVVRYTSGLLSRTFWSHFDLFFISHFDLFFYLTLTSFFSLWPLFFISLLPLFFISLWPLFYLTLTSFFISLWPLFYLTFSSFFLSVNRIYTILYFFRLIFCLNVDIGALRTVQHWRHGAGLYGSDFSIHEPVNNDKRPIGGTLEFPACHWRRKPSSTRDVSILHIFVNSAAETQGKIRTTSSSACFFRQLVHALH
jgi:hypothetical protein